MDDTAGHFLDVMHRLEDLRDAMTPERAHAEFDETTLQVFWMKWPGLSAWAGSWRMLSEELAGPATRTATTWMRSAAVTESSERPRATAVRVLGDLMHTYVATTTPATPVAEAAAGMVAAKVGSAVVMQGPFLAGILAERDVLRAAASGEDLSASTVSAWMTPDPQSASPETAVEDAAQIMLLNGFRHLPVVDGRTVCSAW